MGISVFDLFSIGIGPSSSHTVGPMRAAFSFASLLVGKGLSISSVTVDLYGSLALTGKGHGTDIAIMLGLEGEKPECVDPDSVPTRIGTIQNKGMLDLFQKKPVPFQILFHRDQVLPYHPNGMRFTVRDEGEKALFSKVYYSVGGGFVVGEKAAEEDRSLAEPSSQLPHAFDSADSLLSICQKHHFTIAEVMMENEKAYRTVGEIKIGLLRIWDVMQTCVKRGCEEEGVLPGGLNVRRRAKHLYHTLKQQSEKGVSSPTEVMEWVSLWALAVNEENAAGGRVVTAPTNGAAGVIPAVLHYYFRYTLNPTEKGLLDFMLTAGAVGILYKLGASISAAEMGCMGEVGVACSMAAAGLTAALHGTNEQIENAAEIGMEHNLGLTCDPVKGLVQIPCIERNTMGAIKAINASLLALQGDGKHHVSLDQVIATMRQTGRDMQSIYKETSLGGLAVNVPEC